jgi:prepilin-type N-terminal cleavage/methylation domain-containing protein
MTRRGFSLVEVMIAIVILTAGILALAATSGAVVRLTSQGGRMGGSSLVAEGRFELLRATACASLASGSTVEAPYTVVWTVVTSGNLRTIGLTVSYPTGRRTRSDSYSTTISCAT